MKRKMPRSVSQNRFTWFKKPKRALLAPPLGLIESLEGRRLLSASLTLSGTQTISPGSVINASNDPNNFQSEMSVVVNPTNPLNIVGISHRADPPNYTYNVMDVYYSVNGGATWNTVGIDGSDDGLGIASRFDPTITFDSQGYVYIGYGALPGTFNSPTGATSLIVGRSTNGGASFDQFTVVDTEDDLDKWFMTSGPDPVSGNDAIYIAYNSNVGGQHVVISGSNDAGATFTTPREISESSVSLFASPAVGPNGELYVSWQDYSAGKIYLDRDLDGLWGNSYDFGTDILVRNMGSGNMLFTYVPAQPDRGIHSMPNIAVDRSGGTYNGTLYVAFGEMVNSSTYDSNILVGRSTDQGSTWSFVTVDSSTSTEFHAWMDVDQSTGSANTLYYTTDGDQNSGNDDVKIRMATSLNGGVNWTTANLTTTTSNETGGYFGDYLEYIGLDVYDGTAHGLFSFRHDATDDLDALTVDAAFVNSNNTLTINGDDTGTTNDTIVVQRSAVNSAYLEVFVNGHRQFTGRYDTVGKIVVNGLNGNDTITIGSTVTIPTTIDGGAGNDSITGGGGSDTLVGGSGNDVYIYAGASNLGSDQIVEAANADTDTIDFTNFNTGGYPVSLNLSQTTSQTVGLSSLHVALANIQLSSDTGIENLQGSNYAGSIFTGNSRNNALIAGSSANFSVLQGNDGNDTLTGGPVNDTLIGGNGNDSVTGNAGNDWIFFDAGDDALNGGTGNDMYLIQGATNLGTDQVIEPDNADSDTLDFSNFTTSGYQVQIDLSQTTSQTVGLSFLNSGLVNIQLSSATGIENVTGTNNAGNLLTGNSRNNVLSAGSGNNFSLLQGGDGNDTLNGGAGSDTLIGGNGNDSTAGNAGSDLTIDGAGDDTMSGGTGNDTYILGSGTNSLIEAANADTDTLDLSGLSQAASLNIGQTGNQTVAAGVLTLNLSSDTGIENVNGSSFADSITGNARDNSILGNAGDDTLYGVDGNDTIRGGDGNDVIDGGLGTDSIFGDNGNDSITALDSAADTIDGGAGTDTVTSHDSLDSITNVEVIN